MDNEAIQVYGAKWCGDCFRAKMILDHHHINPLVIDIEHDENAIHSRARGVLSSPRFYSMMVLYLSNQQASNPDAN